MVVSGIGLDVVADAKNVVDIVAESVNAAAAIAKI